MSKKNCTFAQLKFNIMTLGRKLIFTDQFELNAYLQDNVLNTELYKAFLSVKDHRYRWKHTPVETFNEVYYQCTRVFNDPNPESDILGSYLNDAKDNMGTRYASDLIFSMVNAIFNVMADKPANIDFFQVCLKDLMKDDDTYFKPLELFADEFVQKHGLIHLEFPYSPVPPEQISSEELMNFDSITHDYEEYYIRKLVDRYEHSKDKLKLIDIIEKAYNNDNKDNAVEVNLNYDNLPF